MARQKRPWLRFTFTPSRHVAYVQGMGARSAIEAVGGTAQWVNRRRAWHTSAHRARDALAWAEFNGYAIVLTSEDTDADA